jgi:gliding motility-associated-like protein
VIDCGKDAVQLYAYEPAPLSSYTYSWDPVVTATVSGSASRTLTTNRAGLYIVNVTDPANGCTSTGFLEVVNGTLTAALEADPTSGYPPLQVNLVNKSATTNNNPDIRSHWNFGNGLDSVTPKLTPVSMLYQQPGTYTVTLWTSAGVCLDSASLVVNVEMPSSLRVPDVFSPNGDGVNDIFFVKLSGLRSMLFRVFDRWGHLVYELDNAAGIEWNGKNQSGKEVSEGVYFYTVVARGNDGKEFNLKGTITLVR